MNLSVFALKPITTLKTTGLKFPLPLYLIKYKKSLTRDSGKQIDFKLTWKCRRSVAVTSYSWPPGRITFWPHARHNFPGQSSHYNITDNSVTVLIPSNWITEWTSFKYLRGHGNLNLPTTWVNSPLRRSILSTEDETRQADNRKHYDYLAYKLHEQWSDKRMSQKPRWIDTTRRQWIIEFVRCRFTVGLLLRMKTY